MKSPRNLANVMICCLCLCSIWEIFVESDFWFELELLNSLDVCLAQLIWFMF